MVLLVSLLVAVSSLVGLLNGNSYENDVLRNAFLPNDVVNLFIGVPMLIACNYWFLLLPGALAYHIYSSLTYVIALSSYRCPLFFLQLVVLAASAVSAPKAYNRAIKLLYIDKHQMQKNHSGSIHYGGFILMLWGLLFSLRAIMVLRDLDSIDDAELAVSIADVFIGPTWVIAGYELFQHANILLGINILFQASALFYALVAVLMLKPVLALKETENTFAQTDVVVVSTMGLSVLIPFSQIFSALLNDERKVNNKRMQ